MKEEHEKADLKLSIQNTKIIYPVPITLWQTAGGKVKIMTDFLFSWIPKSLQTVTAAMKLRHLFLGRKAMTNLDSILKNRDIILPTKVRIVKAVVSPIVMYGCESWTVKKAEN